MHLDHSVESDQRMALFLAADLQDDLLTAGNDLDRLQSLLEHACGTLSVSFLGACEHLRTIESSATADAPDALRELSATLGNAVTALQFQDMASQLIAHLNRRLRSCADRLARDAMADDDDGASYVAEAPLRPNPVTQDEMDAGSIELF